MPERDHSLVYLLVGLLLLAVGCLYTVYIPNQGDFWQISGGAVTAWIGFLLLISWEGKIGFWTTALSIGLLIRVVLVFAFPNLSDDVYRFIWDGRCLHAGISPYVYLPSDLVGKASGVDQALLDQLNSPDYYSVYPPVAQLLYYIATVGGVGIATSAGLLKVLHVLIEVLGAVALYQLAVSSTARTVALRISAIYYLCPLVIIEGVGNLHHESMSIGLLLFSLVLLYKGKWGISAIVLMLGAGIKLIPLIAAPYVLYRLRGAARLRYGMGLAIAGIALAGPVLYTLDTGHFLASIDLYFRKFEFNASVYYLLRSVGKLLTGYNLIAYIGPLLALLPIAYCLRAIISVDKHSLEIADVVQYCLIGLTVYYLCATTVHPWYIINLVPLAAVLGYRYTLVWAGVTMLTYINYSYEPYYENLWIVALEYTVVIAAILYDWRCGLRKVDLLS